MEWIIGFHDDWAFYDWTERHKHEKLTVILYCYRKSMLGTHNGGYRYSVCFWGEKMDLLKYSIPELKKADKRDGFYEIRTDDLEEALELVYFIKEYFEEKVA